MFAKYSVISSNVVSNSGYVLLGYLIEKIGQQNYSQFVQENIFKPLGMKNSGYDSNSAIIVHRASGYSPGEKGATNTGYIDMSIPFSAGGLYSTTEDLLRWEQGLMGGKWGADRRRAAVWASQLAALA